MKKLIAAFLIALTAFVVFSMSKSTIYANDDEVRINIVTTKNEYEKLYEWFLKDNYEIGEIGRATTITAKVKTKALEPPKEKMIEKPKLDISMTPLVDILEFFRNFWIYIAGVLALLVVTIVVRLILKSKESRGYYSDYDTFSYRSYEEDYQPALNLHQRLRDMGAFIEPTQSHENWQSDGVYIVPRRDYSRYNENGQSNLIRQRVMYYK